MFLKRLELIGFKSFAKRTELEFGPGVTAVVGPNGSGKSNISDSIRWVLGEQSAKSLRGSKMEDIIFAGSDARKPVNYCEVSLTLDNADHTLKLDYSEVTITRRVYRSGDSEYYINKQACRLRDIVELFMDTGLGKEAYSIIGQGRIEEILSTKSEDRRGIFEEAAGIVKYKARKRESEKKLDETEANLVRIHDIITEISGQIDSLKQQADQARHYLELKDELKQQEVSLSIHHIEHLHDSWKQAKDLAYTYNEQLTINSSELSSLDAQLSDWKWNLSEQDYQLEELQSRFLQVSEEVEKTEGKREVLRERKKNAEQNQHATKDKMLQFEQKMEQIEKQRENQEQELSRLVAEYQSFQHELDQKESRLMEVTRGLQTDVEQLKGDYIELLNQIASAKNELRHAEHTQQMLMVRQGKLQEQRSELQGQEANLNLKKEQREQELQEKSKLLDDTIVLFKQLTAEQKEKQVSKEQVLSQLRNIEQKIQSSTSRRDVLQEMQSAFSGFMQGVKEILKAREKGLGGIHGAIAELLSVPPSYETAIEIALGGALQHVVVEDEAAGRKAIQWLKDQRLGRATFLPLDVIRSRRIASQDETELRGIAGFVGIASDLVESDRKYCNISENLLGSVIVMKTLEQANQAARRFGYRYRFVTLEGDVVNPGGAMTGGTVQQKNTNLLGRSRQIEELEQQITGANVEKEKAISQLAIIDRKLREIASSLEELRQKGEEYRLQEQHVKSQLSQMESEKKNVADQLHMVQREWSALTEDVALNEQKRKDLDHQLLEWSNEEKRLNDTISHAESHRSSLEQAKEEYTVQITELKIKAAEHRKLKEAVQSTIHRLMEEYTNLQDEWKISSSYQTNLLRVVEENLVEEEEAEKQIAQLRLHRETVGNQINQLKQERLANNQQIDQVDSQAKVMRKQIKDIEKKLHQEELKVGRLDVELDNHLHHLLEEYGLSYEVAKETFATPEDPKQTGERVQELKKEIQELGVINIGAIEEYDRQSERLDFLSSQSKDLEEAKQTLYQVILEIEGEMSRRFSETFEQIRVEFQQIFTHLFVGGRADLILSDPEDILTTGIDIVAQPPGKKLQNLALLSGGEKALTAIALLFSILRIKPVPFCVLDEVEAALDDANVYRFAEFLREFSGQTQFICVTHRKGTMEGADVLYGVTMQEFGVSKLVSVKLEDKHFITA